VRVDDVGGLAEAEVAAGRYGDDVDISLDYVAV
jgi:hypothetical protein